MSVTSAIESEFLAAILADPEDNTPRLVYADWLDEHAGDVVCPKCEGKGSVPRYEPHPYHACRACGTTLVVRDDAGQIFDGILPKWCGRCLTLWPARHDGHQDCPACSGSGRVPDGRAARAEFIRVQCERPRLSCLRVMNPCTDPMKPTLMCSNYRAVKKLLTRESALRDAHPEWSKLPCPTCSHAAIRGEVLTDDQPDRFGNPRASVKRCPTCDGTGDLLMQHGQVTGLWTGPRPVIEPRQVEFRRGFVDEVGCTLEELGEVRRVMEEVVCESCDGAGWYTEIGANTFLQRCGTCDGLRTHCRSVERFVPSPWARAVIAAAPVTRLRLTDADLLDLREYGGGDDRWALRRERIPEPLWQELCPGSQPSDGYVERRDRREIEVALARAAARLVRSHI